MPKDIRGASGSIKLCYEWCEKSSGYNDEEIKESELKVVNDNTIQLVQHEQVKRYRGSGYNEYRHYNISVTRIIELIQEHGELVEYLPRA